MWWLPIFAKKDGNLPKYLYWFQTFDATLDAGWKDGYIAENWGSSKIKRFVARVYWLYRNPCYGFDYFLFGKEFDITKIVYIDFVNSDEKTVFICEGTDYFNIFYENSWITLKLGWKAYNNFNDETKTFSYGSWGRRIPLCCSIEFRGINK